MKRVILTAAVAISAITTQAQDLKPVLTKTFLAFDTTQAFDTKVEQSNKLGLITKKWDGEWVTHYYAAYSKAILSYMEKDTKKRDAYLDDAEKEKEEAVAILKKENDETYVLAAMIANARLAVDPPQRWQKYGKIYSDNLQSAKEINPENPRMYYLQGTSKFFTPKAFGGGKKAAIPYFEKAEALFAKQPGGDITKPYWGKMANTYFLAQCKVEDKE
ncbi:MAG: hypothetical protein V4649_00920 [Bacteroidota bacterium]